jgi:tRNA pseudouridine38/39 synthase
VQVRCIAAVLIMVGSEAEDPSIITELLDVHKLPAKPQYNMASEVPLLLHDAGFPDLGNLHLSDGAALHVLQKITAMVEDHEVRLGMLQTVRAAVEVLKGEAVGASGVTTGAQPRFPPRPEGQMASKKERKEGGLRVRGAPHIPLLKRAVEPSVAERAAALAARRMALAGSRTTVDDAGD